MKTVTIGIGNSDDKLTQVKWSNYVRTVDAIVASQHADVHFAGGSSAELPWQNYCWVLVIKEKQIQELKTSLVFLKTQYEQESIAFVVGNTELI